MSDRQFSPIYSLDLHDKDLIRWFSYNLQNKVCEVTINSRPLRALNVLFCKFKNLPLFRWLKTLFSWETYKKKKKSVLVLTCLSNILVLLLFCLLSIFERRL